MSKSTTPPNGAPDNAAKAVRFVTEADPEPPELEQVSRDPRKGEAWAPYVNKEGKTVQLVAQEAALTAEKQLEVAQQLLAWAESQAERGIAGAAAKRVLAADRVWRARNPQIQLPDGAADARDLYGRWNKGLPRVVSIICERLTHDPGAPLSDAEAVALDTVPELAAAVRDLEDQRAAALERVREAAEIAQAEYPSGPVGPVVVREPDEAKAS